MNFPDYVADDLRNIISDVPQVFVFQDQEYTGSVSGTARMRKLEIGGFDDMPDLNLIVSLKKDDGTATFVNSPKVGDAVTVNGIRYRVDRSEVDALLVGLKLGLKKDTK